jgi:FMN reductase (NADPH)/FMN reductase [NAD(P)H]
MNPTIEQLMQRRSVRSYSEREVSAADRETIINATLRAPTAGNMMLYSIIEIDDQVLKERLAETCDNQPFIARAPYLLLFAADYQRWYDYYLAAGVPGLCAERGLEMRKPGEGDLLLAMCDTLIAAQTAVIAAEALGISSCYIGDILEQYEVHRELLNLPPYVLPVTMICFGWPLAESAPSAQTPRFPVETILHKNSYRRLSPAGLTEMMRPRSERLVAVGPRKDGIENAGQFNYFRKFSAEFSVEMTRSAHAMIESWKRGEG